MGMRYTNQKATCLVCKREVAVVGNPNGHLAGHGPSGNTCPGSSCRPGDIEAVKRRLELRIQQYQVLLGRLRNGS